jgi:alpha-amylase/alpha-mannosidase (GH57 family)
MTTATQTLDQTFRRLICEHFGTTNSKQVIQTMGPTWYADGIRRIEAGDDTAEKLFGKKWKLKP